MPGIAFPRPASVIVGPLGLGSPRVRARDIPCPAVLCVATTAFVRPGRCAFGSLPVPWVDAFLCVPPGLRRGWFVRWPRRPANARVLITPVTLAPAIVPKETGGSPEFPDYPFESTCPALRPRWCPARLPWREQDCCLPMLHIVGFGSGCPALSSVHHYTFFGIRLRGLCSRLTSASNTAFPRSPFGSAADLVASLWSGGT